MFIDVNSKLVFFTIPKVACTEWIRLFIRMSGAPDWQSDPHYRDDRPLFSAFPLDDINRIINDPAWTKAVFFRNPAERILSAYLDKIADNKSMKIEVFGDDDSPVSFERYLSHVLAPQQSGISAPLRNVDAHWCLQTRIANIYKLMHAFDFIGNYAHLHNHARQLLTRVGIWERYGADGWGEDGGFSLFESNTAEHRTDAGERMDEFYSPKTLARVQNAHREDYDWFDRVGLGEQPVVRR